jgi:hypothetical protein
MQMSGIPIFPSSIAEWKNGLERTAAKQKRAGEPALFLYIFLLPVGLADLMTGRYCGFPQPSTGNLQERRQKKGRTGKGAASLTGRKSHRAATRVAGPMQGDCPRKVNN